MHMYRIVEEIPGSEGYSEEPGGIVFGDLAEYSSEVVREFSSKDDLRTTSANTLTKLAFPDIEEYYLTDPNAEYLLQELVDRRWVHVQSFKLDTGSFVYDEQIIQEMEERYANGR